MMNLEQSFVEVEKLINDIGMFHDYFSKCYYDSGNNDSNVKQYNLKRLLVKQVVAKEHGFDMQFLISMMNYLGKVSETLVSNPFSYDSDVVDFRFRVKQLESVINKILHYSRTHEDGEIPIQKCLNDLVGCRVIVHTKCSYTDIEDYINSIDNVKKSLIKVCYREDGFNIEKGVTYKGIHVYFKNGDNKYFPWELQIWKSEDEENNELSHKLYKEKREYISWADDYENNSERNHERGKEI